MNALIPYEVDNSPVVNDTLLSMIYTYKDLAMEQLKPAIEGKEYSGPEVLAMVTFETLRIATRADMANNLIKARILQEIEEKNLWTVHPERFASLKEAAQAYKISISMLSDLSSWNKVVFPYLKKKGITIAEVTDQVCESNLREITPILVAAITGEPSKSKKVNETVQKLFNDVEITEQATGQALNGDEKVQTVVEMTLVLGAGTNNQLRQALRPTPPIEAAILSRNGTRFLLAEMDEDQWRMVQRIMGDHLEAVYADLLVDPLDTIGPIRKLLGK